MFSQPLPSSNRALAPAPRSLIASPERHALPSQRIQQPNYSELEREVARDTKLRFFEMKRQHKRQLWHFIRLVAKDSKANVTDMELISEDATSAYCLKCRCHIYFKVGQHRVVHHMETFHLDELVAFTPAKKRRTNEPTSAVGGNSPRGSGDAESYTSEPEPDSVSTRLSSSVGLDTANSARPLRPVVMEDYSELARQVERETNFRFFDLRRQHKKFLWQFVRLVAKEESINVPDMELTSADARSAYCLKCRSLLDFKVGQHGVTRHMKAYHPEVFDHAVQRPPIEQQGNGNGSQREALAEPSVPLSSRSQQNFSKPPLSVISRSRQVPSNSLRPVTQEQQKHVNQLLAKWLACSFRPMDIVDDEGFLEFVQFVSEDLGRVKLDIPTSTQLSSELSDLGAELRSRVQQDIVQGCKYFSLTIATWTGRNDRKYFAPTIHYVDQDFYPKRWTLEVVELPGVDNDKAIAAVLSQMMEEWSISTYYCTRIVSAGEADVEKAAALLRIQHMQCIAHSIHFIVAGTMMEPKVQATADELPPWADDVKVESSAPIQEHKEDEPLSNDERAFMKNLRALAVDDVNEYLDKIVSPLKRIELDAMRGIVDKFRTLARYFIKSPKAQRQLEAIQVREYPVEPRDVVSLRLDCPTRSSTSCHLVQHLEYLEPALDSFFRYIKSVEGREEFQDTCSKLRKPTADECLALKCLCTLLGPFMEVPKILVQQTYPTIPLILPATSGIRKWLNREDLFDAIAAETGAGSYVGETVFMMNECRKTLLELLDDNFKDLENSELAWASILDPRIAKTMPHLSPVDIPITLEKMAHAAVELANKNCSTAPRSGIRLHQRPSAPAAGFTSGFSLNEYLYGDEETEQQPSHLDHDCDEELRLYLADVKSSVGRQTDPFEWWRTHKGTYPNLSRLARKWMGVVATSVPSKLAFSTSGTVSTVKRSSLAPSMIRDVVFVSENWRQCF
ncbi:putative AC transposase [Phytophthora citrophthora]|uniref:AC transposase n=1 Tax=Phytophthora citrophthora TaxID=4793 RepID=A0AAD9GNP2_9STRA|nr:putative AC transposase [Phytophthora citrophthora]